MALLSPAAFSLECLVLEELDPLTEIGLHMRVVFEEIVDLSSGSVSGHEVLTRVTTPDFRSISPEVWFAQARKLGLAARLEARAAELALLNTPKGGDLLSVNFSPDCLDAPEVQAVLDKLAELDRVIVIELAEHHHTQGAALERSLASIRDRDLLVAVDDAGTGDSGPEFVREVSPDVIKVDRRHVKSLHTSATQKSSLRSFVELADDTDAAIVAEGVSSASVAQAITDLGNEWGTPFLGQGFWLTQNLRPSLRLVG